MKRDPKGYSYHENNPNAKLTEALVAEIRRLYAAGGVFQHQFATQFGVSQTTINFVVNHRTWR